MDSSQAVVGGVDTSLREQDPAFAEVSGRPQTGSWVEAARSAPRRLPPVAVTGHGSWKRYNPLSRSLARMYSSPVSGCVHTSTPQKLFPPS